MIRLFGELTLVERMQRAVVLTSPVPLLPALALLVFELIPDTRHWFRSLTSAAGAIEFAAQIFVIGFIAFYFVFYARKYRALYREIKQSGGLLCKWCGYDLRACGEEWKRRWAAKNASGCTPEHDEDIEFICPECGKAFEPIELQHYWSAQVERWKEQWWIPRNPRKSRKPRKPKE
ncbi:MAG: hypothetical protein EA380_00920 [Phycisphaeraceae bacterium]|nr:MAG: hypothetical protein EA380_00920 [Phycisphaeraceae bacterium]